MSVARWHSEGLPYGQFRSDSMFARKIPANDTVSISDSGASLTGRGIRHDDDHRSDFITEITHLARLTSRDAAAVERSQDDLMTPGAHRQRSREHDVHFFER